MLADAWCAAFVIPKCFPPKPGDPQLLSDEPVGITQRELNAYAMGQALPQELAHTVEELATQYQFFHWHLAFPEGFGTGGFDVILGNPPWEQLEQQDTITFDQHLACMQSFIERCNKYKFTSSGRKNLYGLFAELSIQIKSSKGASGLILPTGIIQDHPQSSLTSYLMENLMLSSVYDFENKIKGASGSKWFGDAHPQQRFCLYTVKSNCKVTKFSCDRSNPKEIDLDYKKYYLNYNDVIKLCYKNFKVPIYPYNFDKQICQKCYNQGTILGSLMDGDNPKIISTLLFNADKVSKKIRKSIFEKQKTDISIYEGSYIHHYDHRYATYYGNKTNKTTPIQKNNQFYEIDTQFYIDENEAKSRIVSTLGTTTKWILALRRQARSSDSFIAISSLIPAVATEGSITAFLSRDENSVYLQSLCANFNSYIFNYLTRLIQSGPNLNKSIYSQLPIIIPNTKFIDKEFKYFIFPRLFEMTYTSWAMSCFANEFKFNNPPFIWNENRRFLLRCELDAAFFHLYLTSNQNGEWIRENNESENDFSSLCETFPTPRHAVNYIMDTFPIV
ncbi:MAG: hypothetical protein EOM23_04990, partial [Candidatus Moranbacteria bacterium]|nr:hypothetical protein [Candidatus Moranbacteria bacterium]